MAPPQGQMRPGRQLAVLGLIFVVLYLLVFFSGGASGGWKDRLEPRLGLDLVGGTRLTLEATNTVDGKPPTAGNLEEARQIIESRVNAYGVAEAEVVTEGNRNIVISLPGQNRDLTDVGSAAELRFRKVLKATDGSGAAAAPAPTPSVAPSGTASPAPSGSASPQATTSPKVSGSPSAGGQGGMAPNPSASASATPSASPSAASPSASAEPVPQSIEQQRKAVEQKVGAAAWAAASGLQAPADLTTDPTLADKLKPFGTLTPQEVAVLPVEMQFNVPTITCAQLDKRPAASIKDEKQKAVACESGAKYLLDVAKVLGTDVKNASAQLDQTSSWVVSLNFTGKGQEKWTALTREAFNNEGQACDQTALGQDGKCRVAVVLDNEIVSSPEIQGVLTGDSQITGSFDNKTANALASQLRYGALPVTFEPQEQQNVTATLGDSHLKAGLLAAGIGMLLVIIYSFFYYRLLGSVIFLSLVLSALLVFGALVVLGRSIGFTLTLAGIAGMIVSLGVAADSFVIYFERLKDEIREGRSPRSAVPRAWIRARRTIISANAITLMSAVVLYIVSVGAVKGFAFALGLATVLDLVVVFLFRHPIMTMFARTRAFLSPRVSGLGRALPARSAESGTARNPRVKEA
ncbi:MULTISPECIES: protein translocase subunit SecD [Micromonospora]|uniref:protein translocase subunit SecD n=1 Tax=Micromonospora TaxID=1873 RepID=UPI0015E80852|nr:MULTISPECIES: protein translocase subunit SecD [Micromonospora]MBC8992683.1 protein translocase subunit SecD [Micromonospora chalcea]MCK1808811.1 protein translocase subunit SecD [Micromonospora sp. R42106]MCK1833357.1 protein translocase subunit SecD [Micromonospora sp. R42003]MCK1845202.1 protein translocase subunit SecD [Micromonospora sp. R42004]MCM1015617.1 protein translocase subunit SecD [Micromonospora sp. XM-20-01]